MAFTRRNTRKWICLTLLPLVLLLAPQLACDRLRTPAVIGFDRAWSAARAVPNMHCIALGKHNDPTHYDCEAEATRSFADFAVSLSSTLHNTVDCEGVTFVPDDGDGFADARLKAGYWKLRIDYRSGTEEQSFTIARERTFSEGRIETGGLVDVPYMIQSICKVAREDGVHNYW